MQTLKSMVLIVPRYFKTTSSYLILSYLIISLSYLILMLTDSVREVTYEPQNTWYYVGDAINCSAKGKSGMRSGMEILVTNFTFSAASDSPGDSHCKALGHHNICLPEYTQANNNIVQNSKKYLTFMLNKT